MPYMHPYIGHMITKVHFILREGGTAGTLDFYRWEKHEHNPGYSQTGQEYYPKEPLDCIWISITQSDRLCCFYTGADRDRFRTLFCEVGFCQSHGVCGVKELFETLPG